MPRNITFVVPCYNEARRLAPAAWLGLQKARQELSLLFVDDGSTDGTAEVIATMCRSGEGRVKARVLPRNSGKAEAVRQGLLAAIEGGADVVGYCDADLSTPAGELLRLVESMEADPVEVLLGSRVKMLGREIDRRMWRHYGGRVFATFASMALGIAVYDTQCGAKLFRVSPALRAALGTPFRTRWVFDVELLARLLCGSPPVPVAAMREYPLQVWRHVGGSKLGLGGMLRATGQVILLFVRYRLLCRRDEPAVSRHSKSDAVRAPE